MTSKSGKVGYFCPQCGNDIIGRGSFPAPIGETIWREDGTSYEKLDRGQDSYYCESHFGPWKDRIRKSLQN